MLEIEKIIGYSFKERHLIEEALTHPSISSGKNKKKVNYERLEFLGDSVINLVVSEMLFVTYPGENEGKLAKRRSNLVCREALVKIAEWIELGKFIRFSPGEEKMGGRVNRANLENALEALAGAIYLDGGYKAAKAFVIRYWETLLASHEHPIENPKTVLQELLQSTGKKLPEYKVISSEGPSHAPLFTIEVVVDGKKSLQATGSTKREAEKMAAIAMLNKIGLDHKK